MTKAIEERFKKILNQVSDQEKAKNRALGRQTIRVLVAIEHLKAVVKHKKGA